MRKQRGLRTGIQLVEMVAATAIFAIFYFSVMDIWPTSAKAASQARNGLMASHICEQLMDQLIYQGYTNDLIYETTPVSSATWPTITSVNNGVPVTQKFVYNVTATSATLASSVHGVDLVVEVVWQEGGITRHVQFETILAGLQ